LHDERSQYLEYQKVQRELEHLTRFYVAWQYYSAQVRSDFMFMCFSSKESSACT